MARAPARSDPSRDAAAILRRLGFAVLMSGLPVFALFARRGIVVLLPIGASLLIGAAALDGGFRPLRASAERLVGSTGILALLFAVLWAAASLVWSSAPAPAGERLLGLLAAPAVALAAYAALPDRMRSANLYLLPLGTLIAAAVVIGMAVSGRAGSLDTDEDGRSLERGLSILVLFTWPAIAWLRSRDRDAAAIALVVLVCAATIAAPQGFAPAALSTGALAYVVTTLGGRAGALAIGAFMAAIVLAAPAIPAALLWAAGAPSSPAGSWLDAVQAWRTVVADDQARLVTGHGFGSLLRARLAGTVPAATPDMPLSQIWYDLGIVGAAAAAVALVAGASGAARSYAPLLPGIMAAFASAFTMACLGIGSAQAWWPAALATVSLIFVAEERGQFRTRRPHAAAGWPTR